MGNRKITGKDSALAETHNQIVVSLAMGRGLKRKISPNGNVISVYVFSIRV